MLDTYFYAVLRLVDGIGALTSFGMSIAVIIYAVLFLFENNGYKSKTPQNHLSAYVNAVNYLGIPTPVKIIAGDFFLVLFILFAYNFIAFLIQGYILIKGQREYIHKLNLGEDPYKWALVGADMITMSFLTTVLGLNISLDSWVWNTVTTAVIPIVLYFMDKQMINKTRQKTLFLTFAGILLVQLCLFIVHTYVRSKEISIDSNIWFLIVLYFLYSTGIITFSYLRNMNYIDKMTADIGVVMGSAIYRLVASSLVLSISL